MKQRFTRSLVNLHSVFDVSAPIHDVALRQEGALMTLFPRDPSELDFASRALKTRDSYEELFISHPRCFHESERLSDHGTLY